MLQLTLRNNQGSSTHDTNVPVDRMHLIQYLEPLKRGSGVGRGFKNRAPNRITIWMGERLWRNVVLPDDYSFESIESVTIIDSKHQHEPIMFELDKDTGHWKPIVHGTRTMTLNVQFVSRAYEVQLDWKSKFDFLGGVGVNDLNYMLNCHVELPADYDTEKTRNHIYDYGETLSKKYGVPVVAEIVTIGPTAPGAVVGEGHLGRHPEMEMAHAGRQQINPVNYPVGSSPITIAALQPFSEGQQGNLLKPGETGETYGSLGPQDTKVTE